MSSGPHLFSNWYFGIILAALDDSMQSFPTLDGALFSCIMARFSWFCGWKWNQGVRAL
jgi:hypothetical protein